VETLLDMVCQSISVLLSHSNILNFPLKTPFLPSKVLHLFAQGDSVTLKKVSKANRILSSYMLKRRRWEKRQEAFCPVFASGCSSLSKDDIRVWASLSKVILSVYSFSKCAKST
jgi:hypothetical protein